ncbi:MAG: glycerol kinase GlpK [Pseudomonadota bacterium]
MTKAHVLAIDQGTTSTRAIIFDQAGLPQAVSQREFRQIYPANGWVEHDPEDIWSDTVTVCRDAIEKAGLTAQDIAAIGITNQRETTVVWDRETGKPVHNAIVWLDRRTAPFCKELEEAGHGQEIQRRSGLLIDPYFSGTKLRWILDNVEGARADAEAGKLAFGTIDSFLLWRLTGGQVHATDATNASRTLLFNIVDQEWDEHLLHVMGIPHSLLPKVMDNSTHFGLTDADLFGVPIPITGMAGDQQAATVGQACFEPGMFKSTYGTGCFVLMNIGDKPKYSENRLLTTTAYRFDGKPTYAIEGSIFNAGVAVKWLRDSFKMIEDAGQTKVLAEQVHYDHGVYLVPAFTGLGAPHWRADARGAIYGLNLNTGPAHIARAVLEAVVYQTYDLLNAMIEDADLRPSALRVDGGMVVNDWLCQFLSDIVDMPVERPRVPETTALGAAYLAGLQVGVYESLDEVTRAWQCEKSWSPKIEPQLRGRLIEGWQHALKRTLLEV